GMDLRHLLGMGYGRDLGILQRKIHARLPSKNFFDRTCRNLPEEERRQATTFLSLSALQARATSLQADRNFLTEEQGFTRGCKLHYTGSPAGAAATAEPPSDSGPRTTR